MLNSRSQEFIDEMMQCLSKQHSLTNATNVTEEMTPMECNSSLVKKIEDYTVPLWEADFLMAFIYVCILVLALLIGTFGNIIILAIGARKSTMNKEGKAFLMNLALADLCVAAVADPMCIIGVVKGEKWFQGRWVLCEVVASMCLTACFCAFLSLTMLTLNRCVFVCMNKIYLRIFKPYVCVILCLTCWVAAFLFEFPNFIGWGDHYFDDKNHQCIWDRTASFSYTLFVSIGLIGSPLVLMAICFILIFAKIWRTKKEVYSFNTDDDPVRIRRVWMESLRTSRTLVIVFIAFLVCWTPYAVITPLDVNNQYSSGVHLFVTLLAHLHSSINFTVYMCSNKSFNKDVMSLFRCISVSLKSLSSDVKTTETSRSESSTVPNRKYYLNTKNISVLQTQVKKEANEMTPEKRETYFAENTNDAINQ